MFLPSLVKNTNAKNTIKNNKPGNILIEVLRNKIISPKLLSHKIYLIYSHSYLNDLIGFAIAALIDW